MDPNDYFDLEIDSATDDPDRRNFFQKLKALDLDPSNLVVLLELYKSLAAGTSAVDAAKQLVASGLSQPERNRILHSLKQLTEEEL
jgi:hypothetical protein